MSIKIKKFIIIALVLSLVATYGCDKANPVADPKIVSISAGTTFGFCIGECIKKMVITPSNSIFTVYKREARGATIDLVESKKCQNAISSSDWQALTQTVDYQAFKKIPETIGCPDCTDGGAEWIEIMYGNDVHRVTFEYSKDVPEFSNLLKLVREKRLNFEKTCQ